MVIAFFSYLNSNLSKRFNDCNNFDELIDVCVESIFEFHAVINLAHGSRFCNLEDRQVKLFFKGLGECLSNSVRRSDRFLRNKIESLSEMYPVGFRDCIFILKHGDVVIVPSRSSKVIKNGQNC